jgi:hypothetical protein
VIAITYVSYLHSHLQLSPNCVHLDGLANILIWGYAEPALGMIVGNIATLRPLFRRILHLGTEESDPSNSKGTPSGFSNVKRAHPYKPFDIDEDHELAGVSGRGKGTLLETQIHGGRDGRSSLSSDSESQKHILDNKHIVVSQQVEISRS